MSQFPELVQALLQTGVYPEKPQKIELMQTQMSFIFLAGDYVYKIKKPVNLGYLDYTSLEKRKALCYKELELNRRLSPEIYLDVLPVTKEHGLISLNGSGEIIEYAVKMRYLPQERMMNVLLGKDQVTTEMVQQVAAKLAGFHAEAETNPEISTFGKLAAIKVNTDENFSQTEKYFGQTIKPAKFQRIKEFTNNFLITNKRLFEDRVVGGRIRDCHGDLHAAHICFANGLYIYDCIEFNERFRYCDVASEISFLAMDLDHYGRADLSRSFVNAYVAESKDTDLLKLLNFYKCYRAYVRGKVEGFKLDDPYISETDKQQTRRIAAGYFDLSEAYTWQKPKLIITVGLVGTGKSTVSGALAKRLGLTAISSDVTRKTLAGVSLHEHYFDNFSGGIYSPEFNRRTYDTMFKEVENILNTGASVILDASFVKREERLKARILASSMGCDFYIIECTLPESKIRERLTKRMATGSVSDGRWEIYVPQKQKFEPILEVPEEQYIRVDTTPDVNEFIENIVDKLTRSN